MHLVHPTINSVPPLPMPLLVTCNTSEDCPTHPSPPLSPSALSVVENLTPPPPNTTLRRDFSKASMGGRSTEKGAGWRLFSQGKAVVAVFPPFGCTVALAHFRGICHNGEILLQPISLSHFFPRYPLPDQTKDMLIQQGFQFSHRRGLLHRGFVSCFYFLWKAPKTALNPPLSQCD